MKYAVELFFAEPFEQHVRSVWKGLSDANITSKMDQIIDIRPHVTLSVYNNLSNVESFIRRFYSFFETVHELELKFEVLSVFPTGGTVFLDPTVTEDLIKLHKHYHSEFSDLLNSVDQYYIPEKWDPHCTLAIRLTTEQVLETMRFCYKDFKVQKSKIVEVGLVKIGFDSEKRFCSPSIALKELKKGTPL